LDDLLKNGRLDTTTLAALWDPYRSYWLPWTIGFAAVAILAFYPLWGPREPTSVLDVVAIVLVFGLPVACAFAGYQYGAKNLRGVAKLPVGIAGFVHGAAQVGTPILLARLFTKSALTCAAGICAVVAVATTLHLARPLFKSRRSGAALRLGGLTLALLAGVIGLLTWSAQGGQVAPTRWWLEALRFAASGLIAMPLGTLWFTWYLAVAGRLDAHNNEVGGAARVTHYRQIIRFHLRADGLTGYVIAIESDGKPAATAGGRNLAFSLIDVFTIKTEPCPAQASPADAPIVSLEVG
jgi:hypothetical protein